MRNPGSCFLDRVCLVRLLQCGGSSTVDQLREDEWRIVVVFLVVVFSVIFDLVVSLSRTCCWVVVVVVIKLVGRAGWS